LSRGNLLGSCVKSKGIVKEPDEAVKTGIGHSVIRGLFPAEADWLPQVNGPPQALLSYTVNHLHVNKSVKSVDG